MFFQVNLLHKAHVCLNMSNYKENKQQHKKPQNKKTNKNNMMEMLGSGKQGTQPQYMVDVAK